MTISTAASPLSYSGDDSTTNFAVTWAYVAKSHVVATLRSAAGTETTWVLDTDYTLTDPGASGTLAATTAPATGETLVITLEPPNTQTSDVPLGGSFPAQVVEDALDLASQVSQKIETLFNRALRVPKTDTRSDDQLEIPNETDRASKFLAFNASGDPIAAEGSADGITVSTFMATVLDDTTAAAARTTLGAGTGNGTLDDLVDDPSPQLGGDLDLNGNSIDFPTTANISDCLDEDDMSSDSATALATQQSIKAYIDNNASSITLGTEQASTSGASIDFTSIPSTVIRVVVMFTGVSTTGSSPILLQIGDSGGIETSGYESISHKIGTAISRANSTSGILIQNIDASKLLRGSLVFEKEDGTDNTWVARGQFYDSTNNETAYSTGDKSLSGSLDRVRVTTVGGSDTFDAGAINIQYE